MSDLAKRVALVTGGGLIEMIARHRRMKERFLAPPQPRPLDGKALRTLLGREEHQAVATEMARFAS